MSKFVLFLVLLGIAGVSFGQELQARVNVVSSRVGSGVDRKVFQTLQTALNDFVNNRKWTNDNFKPTEKIECSFLLNVESTGEPNVYTATLTVQSARPVYHSTYNSPLVNYIDNDVVFKYSEFEQLQFNENRVAGTDALQANLTAVIAYWINMILGFDYDSFSPGGGKPFFQRAQNIVNTAPEGRIITGWKAFDGTRNRYWLMENLTNSRYNLFHDIIYSYYRGGMDKMAEDAAAARSQIINTLSLMNTFQSENPNTMILPFFMQAKTQEMIGIFSKASPPEKARALDLLSKIDVTNTNQYREALQ